MGLYRSHVEAATLDPPSLPPSFNYFIPPFLPPSLPVSFPPPLNPSPSFSSLSPSIPPSLSLPALSLPHSPFPLPPSPSPFPSPLHPSFPSLHPSFPSLPPSLPPSVQQELSAKVEDNVTVEAHRQQIDAFFSKTEVVSFGHKGLNDVIMILKTSQGSEGPYKASRHTRPKMPL